MRKYIKKNLSFFSFLLIPIIHYWDPNWLSFLGVKPYWPLFWLLPWAMIYGPVNSLIVGLLLGIFLDSIVSDTNFTQVPGLVLCGIWFGKFNVINNSYVGHLRYGLICSLGSFLCGFIYFLQIFIKNLFNLGIPFYEFGIKNIFAQVFVTGLLAPLFCSWLLILFKIQLKERN